MTANAGPGGPPALEGYAHQVAQTWRRDDHNPEQWRDDYADLIRGEFHELIGQHGIDYTFLDELEKANDRARTALIAEHKRQYDGLIGELGDLLWFSFRVADELQRNPSRLSAMALSNYSKTAHIFGSFTDIENAVADYAEYITVPTKWALKNPGSTHSYSLKDAPGYVLMRMVFRLGRALDGGRHDNLAPPSASMLEPVPDLDQSIGDCINTVAYISSSLLATSTAEIARRNIEKLQHRAAHGKQPAD